MENLQRYIWEAQIDEGLLSGIGKFFSKIFKVQKKFGEAGEKIKVDIKKIKRCKKPLDFVNLETKEYKVLLEDKTCGFPIFNEFVKNPKKYLGDAKDSSKTYLHFQELKNGAVQAGAIMYTESPEQRKGEAVQLLCIESSLIVENTAEVNKCMIDIWMDELKKNKEWKYIFAIPTHPKIKGILTQVGFSTDKANKEMYIKQIK